MTHSYATSIGSSKHGDEHAAVHARKEAVRRVVDKHLWLTAWNDQVSSMLNAALLYTANSSIAYATYWIDPAALISNAVLLYSIAYATCTIWYILTSYIDKDCGSPLGTIW